jgi:hypothetical protein
MMNNLTSTVTTRREIKTPALNSLKKKKERKEKSTLSEIHTFLVVVAVMIDKLAKGPKSNGTILFGSNHKIHHKQ